MDENKNKTSEIQEISAEELEKAAGGWKYDGFLDWLKGYDVVCPYCGSGSADDVAFRLAAGPSCAVFTCKCCGRDFSYHYQSKKIWRMDDHGDGI